MSITVIIIITTAIISIMAFRNYSLMNKWIFSPYQVKENNEYHRFLTSGFLHADWMHLIINMLVLFFFGPNVEGIFKAYWGSLGIYYFILLYLGAIVISEISTFKKYQDHPGYRSLGASGATSAVLFASVLIYPINKICLWGILCLPGFIMAIGYLYYSAQMSKKTVDNINHDAHFYGAAFGFVYPIVLKPVLILQFIDQIQQWITSLI